MYIIPAVRGQLRQEDCHELEISLDYRTRLCLKNLKGSRIFISKGGPILLSIAFWLVNQPASSEKSTFLVCSPIAVIKHWPKLIWGQKGLFDLQVTLHHCRKPRPELRAGAGSRHHGGMLLPGWIPQFAQLLFFYSPGPPDYGWQLVKWTFLPN